jgi:hypothetical protein
MRKYLYIYSTVVLLISVIFINARFGYVGRSDKLAHSPGLELVTEDDKIDRVEKITPKNKKLPFFSDDSVERIINDIWSNYPTVDGLLEPHKYNANFSSEIAFPTQTNVFSGKITGTTPENPNFDGTENIYNDYEYENRTNVNFVKTARELSCIHTDDYIPEFIHYQQKPWATPYFNYAYNSVFLENRFSEWISTVSRMIQPYYSKSSNEELYFYNQHYAGAQFKLADDGLTKKGELLVKAYVKYGGMLDASHVKNNTLEDMLSISKDLVSKLGVPVPIFLNHANIDARNVAFPSYLGNNPANYSRNKSPKEICQAAKSGAVWGVMPVKLYTDQNPEDADFYDLADQIYFMKNYDCFETGILSNSSFAIPPVFALMVDYKGDTVKLINHIIVSSDANIFYFDKDDDREKKFYIDEDAANLLKWKKLAKYLLSHDFNNDGHRDFTVDDIKKIFGLNAIKSYVRALDGALPFGHKYCTLLTKKRYYFGRFSSSDKSDFAIADNEKIFFSKSYLQGHFDGVSKKNNHNKWCLAVGQQSVVGDFNGDGLDDFLCYTENLKRLKIKFNNEDLKFNESNFLVSSPCGKAKRGRLYAFDLDSDGKDELLCHNEDGDVFQVNVSRKVSTVNKLVTGFCSNSNSKFFISLLDLDNKADFYCHHPDGSHQKILSSSRRVGLVSTSYKKWCRVSDTLQIHLGDFDGDGRADRLCHSNDNGRLWIDYASNSYKGTDWSEYGFDFCTRKNEQLSIAETGGDSKDDVHCYEYRSGYLSTLRGSKKGLKRPKDFTIY